MATMNANKNSRKEEASESDTGQQTLAAFQNISVVRDLRPFVSIRGFPVH